MSGTLAEFRCSAAVERARQPAMLTRRLLIAAAAPAALAARAPFWVQGVAMAALILIIQTLAGRGSAPFVYGNF